MAKVPHQCINYTQVPLAILTTNPHISSKWCYTGLYCILHIHILFNVLIDIYFHHTYLYIYIYIYTYICTYAPASSKGPEMIPQMVVTNKPWMVTWPNGWCLNPNGLQNGTRYHPIWPPLEGPGIHITYIFDYNAFIYHLYFFNIYIDSYRWWKNSPVETCILPGNINHGDIYSFTISSG